MNMEALSKAASAFWGRLRRGSGDDAGAARPAGIGLALGGGFSRGIAHVGVLRVLERERIPVRWVAGVSAGSIVAAGFAGGADSRHLEAVARSMKFKDVAGWGWSKLGVVASHRMEHFLRRALPVHRFEEMRVPLSVVATDLMTGDAVIFGGNEKYFQPYGPVVRIPGCFSPCSTKGAFWSMGR